MEKIDIHKIDLKYEQSIKRLEQDTSIPAENRENILAFIRACGQGKTVRVKNMRKACGKHARKKSIFLLIILARFFGSKRFTELDVRDSEDLVLALDENKIRKADGEPYAVVTKSLLKKAYIDFIRWLLRNNTKCYEMTFWIDTSFKEKTVPSLTPEEVEEIILRCTTIAQKVLLATLFDGGFGIEEFLNIRNSDIVHVDGRVPYYRFRIRDEFSKTKGRWVPMLWPPSHDIIRAFLASKITSLGEDDPFFPNPYSGVKSMFIRIKKRSQIEKRFYPHLFRHSSATYYVNQGLNEFQLNRRYGWTYTSNQGRRYIDASLISEEKQVRDHELSQVSEMERKALEVEQENRLLRETNQSLTGEFGDIKGMLQKLVKNPVASKKVAESE